MEEETLDKYLERMLARKPPAVLSPGILAGIPDDELVEAILDHICVVRVPNDAPDIEQREARLPAALRMLRAMFWLDAEVQNGGFNQFFYNSTGAHANEALEGFRRIGAVKTATVLERAMALYLDELPYHAQVRERVLKEGTLQAFSESYQHTGLRELDDEYYSSGENLEALQVQWIRAHPEEFVSE